MFLCSFDKKYTKKEQNAPRYISTLTLTVTIANGRFDVKKNIPKGRTSARTVGFFAIFGDLGKSNGILTDNSSVPIDFC